MEDEESELNRLHSVVYRDESGKRYGTITEMAAEIDTLRALLSEAVSLVNLADDQMDFAPEAYAAVRDEWQQRAMAAAPPNA